MKKSKQLGMHHSTAGHRLRIDTLYRLAVKAGYKCYRCGKKLKRKDFSIDHKVPWLDSDNPKKRFFDQRNVAFSHLFCNVRAAKKMAPIYTKDQIRQRNAACTRRRYTKARRRAKYLRTGH